MTTYKIDTPEMNFARDFVLEAGKLIRSTFGLNTKADWKQNETPITAVDIELNKRFIAEVNRKFKGYSVLGEEESKPLSGVEWTWVIDPVDGTGPFVQGLPLSTCCVSLLQHGIPMLGVIYDPMLDRLFYAQKGQGAFMNDQAIRISSASTLDRQFVHLDSLKTGDRRLLPIRQKLLEKGCTPMLINAIQYGTALTCAGQAAGVVFSLPSFWDAAAAYCIGTEAGATVTDLYGNAQRYDEPIKGFILASPVIHAQLVEMVAQCFREAADVLKK